MTSRDHARLLEQIDIAQHSRRGSFEVLLDLIEDLPPGRALDAPCGAGLLSEALHRLGHAVTSADLAADAFVPRHIPFFAIDLDAPLPFGAGAFDLVVCGDGVEHLENPFALFREFSRVLAEGGTLVVATPNYLNLERRLKFLWSGSLTKPLPLRAGAASGPGPVETKSERGHINPLTLIRMTQIAESAGFELVRSRSLLRKPRQYWLAPLALLILAVRPLLDASYRRDLLIDHTLTLRALLGGKKLIAIYRKTRAG